MSSSTVSFEDVNIVKFVQLSLEALEFFIDSSTHGAISSKYVLSNKFLSSSSLLLSPKQFSSKTPLIFIGC